MITIDHELVLRLVNSNIFNTPINVMLYSSQYKESGDLTSRLIKFNLGAKPVIKSPSYSVLHTEVGMVWHLTLYHVKYVLYE